MTNLSKVSQDEVSKNQVIRSNVAKTQQPDAEGLTDTGLSWSQNASCFFARQFPVPEKTFTCFKLSIDPN